MPKITHRCGHTAEYGARDLDLLDFVDSGGVCRACWNAHDVGEVNERARPLVKAGYYLECESCPAVVAGPDSGSCLYGADNYKGWVLVTYTKRIDKPIVAVRCNTCHQLKLKGDASHDVLKATTKTGE